MPEAQRQDGAEQVVKCPQVDEVTFLLVGEHLCFKSHVPATGN